MTIYELLCCFKSPNWYNYQNLLAPQNDYLFERIDRNLPPTVVDSYLGRLLELALVVNKSWSYITVEELDAFLLTVSRFAVSETIFGRGMNAKLKRRVIEYLESGLPPEWLTPLVQVLMLGCWTGKGPETDLNDPKFLKTLEALSQVDYQPVQKWFAEHPEALDSNSSGTSCYNETIQK